MNDVRKYVNKMFSGYPKNDETLELKEEVIGNLEAEIEDLVTNKGLTVKQAFRISTEKMTKLDGVIEGVQTVQLSKVLVELTQWSLIYLLIAWIISIPFNMFSSLRATSWLLFTIILIIGVFYILLKIIAGSLTNERTIQLAFMNRWQKWIWIIWALFMVAQWGMITAIHFGSDLWFGRNISIEGPYQFGQTIAAYLAPFFSVIVPLLINRFKNIVIRGGNGANYEE